MVAVDAHRPWLIQACQVVVVLAAYRILTACSAGISGVRQLTVLGESHDHRTCYWTFIAINPGSIGDRYIICGGSWRAIMPPESPRDAASATEADSHTT